MTTYHLYVKSFNNTLSLITTFYCSSSDEALAKATTFIEADNLFDVVLRDESTLKTWEYTDQWNAQ